MQVAIYLAGNQKWVLEHMVYDGFSKDDSVYTSAHTLLVARCLSHFSIGFIS